MENILIVRNGNIAYINDKLLKLYALMQYIKLSSQETHVS